MMADKNITDFLKEEHSLEPSPRVWKEVDRAMHRKDFWHVKGKLCVSVFVLSVAAVALWWVLRPAEIPSPPAESTFSPVREVREENTVGSADIVSVNKQKTIVSEAFSPVPSSVPAAGSGKVEKRVSSSEVQEYDVTEILEETQLPVKENPIPSAVRPHADVREMPIASHQPRTLSDPKETLSEPESRTEDETSEPIRISFPSAFTPNGDGLNDRYRPVISGEVSQYSMKIYSRNNQLVFQTISLDDAWDGSFRGSRLPQGAFVCVVTFTDASGVKRISKSEFLLLD